MSTELDTVPWNKPVLAIGSQALGSLITILAIHYQRRYNRLHRSIYGLSFDSQLFQFIQHVLSLYCSLNYMLNPYIKRQLQRRYPLFYDSHDTQIIPVSWVIVIFNFLSAWNYWSLIRQLKKYDYTKHIHQGFSSLAKSIIVIFVYFLGIFTFWCAFWFGICQGKDSGLFGLFWLDHVNYFWLLSNIFHLWSFWPQLCINWMGKCCQGLSSKFVILSLLSSLIKLFGITILNGYDKLAVPMKNNNNQGIPYYQWPFNLENKFVIIMELLSIIGILFQAQYFYPNNKPYLPKSIEKTNIYNHTFSIV